MRDQKNVGLSCLVNGSINSFFLAFTDKPCLVYNCFRNNPLSDINPVLLGCA